jgi:hypothetical protein
VTHWLSNLKFNNTQNMFSFFQNINLSAPFAVSCTVSPEVATLITTTTTTPFP